MKMDRTTIIGFISLIVLVVYGYMEGEIPRIIFNLHAFLVVIGGTLIATFISTPYKYIIKTIKSIDLLFNESDETSPQKIISYI